MYFPCLVIRYTSNSDYLTTDDLLLFLEAEQGVGKIDYTDYVIDYTVLSNNVDPHNTPLGTPGVFRCRNARRKDA